MKKTRYVERLHSVFDLVNCKEKLTTRVDSARIMLSYDEKKMIKDFTILGRDISPEDATKITSWLRQDNVVNDIIYDLKSNELNVDNYA